MGKDSKIFVTGHRGMVGSAFKRKLGEAGHTNLLTASRSELDLRDQSSTLAFFREHRPNVVIHAAAKVGGIEANRRNPAEFLYDNLAMQNNVFDGARTVGVEKLLFIASSCMYPRECPQPMKEEYLLTGPLEPTNEAYAIAKIAGMKQCQYYAQQYGMNAICAIPCNIYGPGDSFDLATSHVLSALVRRFSEAQEKDAKEIVLWGTGNARREFLHSDDAADALLLLLERWDSPEPINVGSGTDVTIRELAALVADQVGYKGRIAWDSSKPDGMPRKCVDISKISALGFQPNISLSEGVTQMVELYRSLARA
jgi:GDP-L-fucose synthase